MTTADHVIATCGSLRTAWGWLATAATPGRVRRNQRALSETAKAKRNQRAVAERADKVALVNAGKVVGGGQPPADLGVIDTRITIAADIDQLAAELSLAVGVLSERGPVRAKVAVHYTDNSSTDSKFVGALDWISTRADLLTDQHLIADAHQRLTRADQLARSVAGEGPQRRRLAAECPACGRRSLYWDTGSVRSEEWHIGCDNQRCRCQGRDCRCKMPFRQPGATHLWLESRWEGFAKQLEETA